MLDTGCWIQDTGYWILDTGYRIPDAGYRAGDLIEDTTIIKEYLRRNGTKNAFITSYSDDT